jgi:hypothetical protein
MKPGTLTNFFEKTGTYVKMSPKQQQIVKTKNTKKNDRRTK